MPEILTEIAKSKKEKEKIFEFRHDVMEASRIYSTDSGSRKIEESEDADSILVASYEADKITGTLRTYRLDSTEWALREGFRLDKWLSVIEPRDIAYTSKFMTRGSTRKNRTVLTLMRKHYEFLLEQKIKVDFIKSSEPTIPFYEWIGYRRIGKLSNLPNSPWPLAPMALIVSDTDYLEKIRSPLLAYPEETLKKLLSKTQKDSKLIEFIEKSFPSELITPTAYMQLRKLKTKFSHYFKSEEMRPFLAYLEHHKYINGETIFASGDYGSSIHLIINGQVEIEGENITAGDFFGTACLLKPGKREFGAKAKGELETLELDSNDFYSVLKEKPNIIYIFLQLIADKVRDLNTKNYNKHFK